MEITMAKKKRPVEGKGEGFDFSGLRKHPRFPGEENGFEYWLDNPAKVHNDPWFYSPRKEQAIYESIREFAYKVMSGPVEEGFAAGSRYYIGILNGESALVGRRMQSDDMVVEFKTGTVPIEDRIWHAIWEMIRRRYAETHDEIMRFLEHDGYDKELAEKILDEYETAMCWDD
jgi:hypothetical protein